MAEDKILPLSEIVMGIWRRDSETVFQLSTQLAESKSKVAKLEQAARELGAVYAVSEGYITNEFHCSTLLAVSDETKQIVKDLSAQ